ncbi:TSC22 domain family protein 2-like isoform X2 [Thalassophryne amazonica]|uniref:TSC22 domain family protein 2-like isoform X2 n=1 Tax=Thalassophryne amazonica TaxID=390379 RepID=UPI001470A506|nr:TSC22 domain family protein 2-like isoform X2 [Thalassophryne amazonica]
MSKMPTKKKSCFQITSVTQAQVAAVGAADRPESLDDPDEPRAGEGSPEIFDVSRADLEAFCDRSSSEEVLSNVGEPEAACVKAPSQAGQLSASNPSVDSRKVGVPASSHGVQQQQPGPGGTPVSALITQAGTVQQQPAPTATGGPSSVSVNTSQPAAASSSTSAPLHTSCTSRFRVIKLDHGTGEPFRRGRWMCTEYYEKESESSVSRTDSIRHASANPDPISDRDSGLGLTGGSAVTSVTHSGQSLGSMLDTSHSSLSQQQQMHHRGSSSKPSAVTAQQPTLGGNPPSGSPSGALVGQNGLQHSGVHIHKSSVVPSSAYPSSQQQLPLVHQQNSQSSGLLQNQTEYYQQQQSGLSSGKSPLVSSVSLGMQPVGQGHPSAVTPVSGGASVPSHIGDLTGAGGGAASTGQIVQQSGASAGSGFSTLVGGSALQHQTGSQYTTYAQQQPHSLGPASSGVQNVPVYTVSASVSATAPTAVLSASSAAMPNVTASSLPLGVLGVQGPPAAGQVDDGSGRKSVGLVNMHSPVTSAKESGKSLLPESLQLSNPTVSSLLGIHIPVDGEEDRNPSQAFYQAFQSGSRFRDSKAHSDSASGANVVAIDNKIEQAMDLVKSHLMYAVREEVEVLKEQIKELCERNSVLERENAVLKSLANSEQLSQLSPTSAASSDTTPPQQGLSQALAPTQTQLQLHFTPQQPLAQLQLDSAQQTQPSVTSA